MAICRGLLLTFVIAAGAVAAEDQGLGSSPSGRQTAPTSAPVLSPEEEIRSFVLPPGFRAELVAAEPLVEEPVAIDWDSSGRLWVVELLGYMPDLRATGERQPNGRISILEDTDRDGRMDKKTVFLDGLVLPRALKVLEGGALVGEPPHLWFAKDTTGDLRADTKDLVCDCYGQAMGNVEHNANSLLWALDNRIYTSEGEIHFQLVNGKFEVRRTLMRGQWGASQDDAGFVYRNTSPDVLHVDVVPTPYFFRNPNLFRTRGSDEPLGDRELNTTFAIRSNRGINRGYTPGALRQDESLAAYTGACAPTVYRGDQLPADLYGNVFVAEPTGNLVSRIIVQDDGQALRGRRAYATSEFLASTDERFRPVNLSVAPDGTLFVVDMYRGIIQHMAYMTEYLRDQIVERQLEAPVRRGRIFRIVHDTTERTVSPSLGTESSAQLVARFSHANGWWRDTAQRILVERADKSVVPMLKRLADTSPDARVRLHAMWTLDGLGALGTETVVAALSHPSRDVRLSAIRLAERWLAVRDHPMHAAVLARTDDTDWAVRAQLAASLGELPAGLRESVLAAFIDRHGDDPLVLDAALSGLRGLELNVLERILERTEQTPARDSAITMLAVTIVRSTTEDLIQRMGREIVGEARPMWQRSAILRGLEVALLGAPMPGGGAALQQAVNPPNPTSNVGGGRAGGAGGATGAGLPAGRGVVAATGSAPAFPGTRPRDPNGRPAPTGLVRLRNEPALAGFAGRDLGDLGVRSALVLARIEWPGKPGVPVVAPLTAEESLRFEAGRRVYVNVCQACHQPDGRGQDRLAPSLVGSSLVLAPADLPTRILLNGKEGQTGLMPPLGAALSDDQIAAVLTYIRREWRHTGSSVEAATVRGIRSASAGRQRPWTNAELLAWTPEAGSAR